MNDNLRSAARELADADIYWGRLGLSEANGKLLAQLGKLYLKEHAADDNEPLSLDEAQEMIAHFPSVDLTLGTRDKRVGVYVDNWVPLDNRGDLRRLIAALVREVPK